MVYGWGQGRRHRAPRGPFEKLAVSPGFTPRPSLSGRQVSLDLQHVLRVAGVRILDHDTLDLVDGDRVRRPVVELRRLRRRVPGDLLGVLEGSPVRQIRRDPVARNVLQEEAKTIGSYPRRWR